MDKNQIEFAYFKKSAAHFSPSFVASQSRCMRKAKNTFDFMHSLWFGSSSSHPPSNCTCKRYLLLRVIALARLHAMQNVFIIKKINNWSKIYLRYLFADIEHFWYYVWWWLVGWSASCAAAIRGKRKILRHLFRAQTHRRGGKKHRFRGHMIGEINKNKARERERRASNTANAMYSKKKANMRTKWRDVASHSWW